VIDWINEWINKWMNEWMNIHGRTMSTKKKQNQGNNKINEL